jgi:hypothetical protein
MDRDNLHTRHQPKGSARNLSDTLDRQNEDVAPGQRSLADDSKGQKLSDGGAAPRNGPAISDGVRHTNRGGER